jgi:hypothetical protein
MTDAEYPALAHENSFVIQWKDFPSYFVSLLRAAAAPAPGISEGSGEERRGEERGVELPFSNDRYVAC